MRLLLVLLLVVLVQIHEVSAQLSDSVLLKLEEMPEDTLKVKYLFRQSKKLSVSQKPLALSLAKRALELSRDIGYKVGIMDAYTRMGNIHRKAKEYETSLSYHLKSLAISEQLGDTFRMANSYNRLGLAHFGLKDYENALKFYIKAKMLNEGIKNSTLKSDLLINTASTYLAQKKFSEGLEHLKTAYEYKLELGDTISVVKTLHLSLIHI